MSKIAADHLTRRAYVYIRQSTIDQVHKNLESQRRQYGLADRARDLGWENVDVIDDDLGRSGAGIQRPGFERLLAALCEGLVGAVFCGEASRLARNGRDWHTLLEFCSVVGALLVDADGVYDPRDPNDRLLLGMKGQISEMELANFRARAQAALAQKAARGELIQRVAVGYIRTVDERIEKTPMPGCARPLISSSASSTSSAARAGCSSGSAPRKFCFRPSSTAQEALCAGKLPAIT